MKLNVKGFNLNELAASFCQQGARRRRGGGVAAPILAGFRFQSFSPSQSPACLPACRPAVVQCQMERVCWVLSWLSSGRPNQLTEGWLRRSARRRAAGAALAAGRCRFSAPRSKQNSNTAAMLTKPWRQSCVSIPATEELL